jgi:lysyl-tRNA synthetase class 1
MSSDADTDPFAVGRDPGGGGDERHVFWADDVADEIEARDPEEPIVVKGGISPSGVPHLGNMNEVMRGYFVAEVLRDRGYAVRQVFTADDRDPLRKVPRKLADLDGNVVGLGEVDAGVLGRNLGKPYTDVPDPFGCCDSYGDHFATLIERGAAQLGAPIDVVSNTELYESGEFEAVTRELLADQERARAVLADYQDKADEDYVPFRPICESCGHVTGTDAVRSVDLEAGTVEYGCGDIEAGEDVIEGCGHEGTATLREGKLPWRFEWPAQWRVLGVDHEPFGKDHAEGSWPSGEDVARNVLGFEPPVPMVYEWFTLNGEAFSSSEGHVVLVSDVLELVEPEVLRFFFSKDPGRARNLDLERVDLLADEFDRFERLYYGEAAGTEQEEALAGQAYPPVIRPTVARLLDENLGEGAAMAALQRADIRVRIAEYIEDTYRDRLRFPYTFAAVLGMFPEASREEYARKQGHLTDDAPEWAVEAAFERVERARTWAGRYGNEYDYAVADELPDVDVDDATGVALEDLAAFVAEGHDGEAIQGEVYEAAKRHGVDVGEFFAAGYRLFFDQPEGPQLGHFLGKLDREFVVERLRREG